MTDPFTPEEEEISKIKVGDKEYSQDELDSLISLGSKAQEIEKNHGSLDKFTSEWGRKNDELGKLRAENEAFKVKSTEPVNTEFTQEQKVQAQKQLTEIMGGQPVTQEALETWFESKYTTRRSAEKLIDELGDLEKEIDGSDGRPKFNGQEVLDYMAKNGTKKPSLAYKEMHESELDAWKLKELAETKPAGFHTEDVPTGNKKPKEVRVTNTNLDALLKEQLYSSNQ